ncbi:hypothetical protein N7539_003361 [Penicillium diatomitis]|uniref:Nucleoporin NUP49/NSP49 n=1 Tax=Penicillium diatomitis TaxID=2819901 RepID=A0A9X0BX76_9EURO|nr:uncharacterized protein N7539_003361 [Penicillium diatomitis]KAJ5488471.1 hypothetical protein N7539_003361 [Penicillium diatomitis]
MFAPKTSAPTSSGLTISTPSTSLFGNTNTQSNTNSTSSLFGNTPATTQSKPATGGLFGNTQQTPTTSSGMFGTQQQQPQAAATSSIFGNQQKPAGSTPSLFGNQQAQTSSGSSLFGNNTSTVAAPTTQNTQSSGLFGPAATTQNQAKPAFSLGGSTTGGGGLFPSQQPQQQQQQQQQQQANKPTLNVFGNATTNQATQPSLLQQSTAPGNVVQGVKVDISNLLPTTKFESCSDELRREIETIDNAILGQMKLSHEVSDILPTIQSQGASIPNDVDFVQGKLETMQHALENDAQDIDQLRSLVARNAAEAEVAFRAIDTLKLPLQYQTTGGSWWSVQDQKVADRSSLPSGRKNTLALPDDVEGDPTTAKSVNGVPVNLVDYFSQRSDEMTTVLNRYKGNLKEIEDHLHGVELSLNRQITDFMSKSRDGPGAGTPKTVIGDLAAVFEDVQVGILGVASRLGTASEQVQELTLGPLTTESRYAH